MTYLVSTNRSGCKVWWCDGWPIPDTHTDIRPATSEEAALMDQILNEDRLYPPPSLALGEKLLKLLNGGAA